MNEQNLARVLNNCFVFWLDPKLFEVPFIVDALNGVDHLFFFVGMGISLRGTAWDMANNCPQLIDEINVDLTPFVSNASLECWASTHKACPYVQRFY